ncbi:hypothetical protein EJ03DRAFT_94354 [Teratosphaeria nubilosa]|uniref:Uncharacterized protein n=1 Tax=Teratosphaeria nubilosa TaxID=161662 RepID=A0A6G1L9E1_9PEZI|nr:hypothetical protein EJ03DRAFT_94354 [Teratosphaeria nubilosa]
MVELTAQYDVDNLMLLMTLFCSLMLMIASLLVDAGNCMTQVMNRWRRMTVRWQRVAFSQSPRWSVNLSNSCVLDRGHIHLAWL